MKRFLGFCLVGFCVGSAWGAGAPLILDWGVVDTSSAEQQQQSQALRTSSRAATVQRLSAQGTVPWLVQFNDVIREEWKTAMEAAGAEIRGYMPENGFLVVATRKQIQTIGEMPEVVYVGEFLPAYKRAKAVRQFLSKGEEGTREYNVWLYRAADLEAIAQEIASLPGASVVRTEALPDRALVRVHLPVSAVETVTAWGEVEWVDPYLKPQLWNDVAVRTNMMNVSNVWSVLGLTGAGQTIAVCDTGLDTGNTGTLHPDFTNRVTGFGWTNGAYSAGYLWADTDSHGTHVAGSVLGNGTMSAGRYKGVAYEANLVFQGAQEDLSGIPVNLTTLFKQAFDNGARIHSDSWGYSDNGYYHSDSRYLDMFTWSNKTMLVLVAAGNQGIDSNSDGVIDLDSIGSPATAKNCLTVGAAENYRTSGGYSTYRWGVELWPADYPAEPIMSDYASRPLSNNVQGMAAFSSRGPCDDGRIKPDIVAPGTDIASTRSRRASDTGWGVVSGNTNYLYMGGTSMATPLMAGAVGLTRQWVTTTGGITNPSGPLLKALLLNGARNMAPGQYLSGTKQEIPTARPSNVQGWGHVDLYNTLQPATNQFLDLYDTNSLSTGQTNTFTLTVSATSTNKFILTMAYADYWGTVGSGKQLINDLDLTVVKPGGTTNFANGRTSKDATNNVEMIEFAADETGTYTVRVVGRTVPSGGSQAYALVIRGPLADETPAAPAFGANPGPVSTTTGVAVAFTVATTNGYPTPVLALQTTTASTGYTFTAGSGLLSYTPPVADVGTRTFTFTATNASGSATQTVSVVVYEAPPAAPASIWASATNTTDFTAAWSAVSGATGYRLDVGTNSGFSAGGGANLMANAGFETGDSTDWDKFEDEYSVASTDPYEGSYHVAIAATATRDLTQNVDITGDGTTEYEISYWYKGSGNARIWASWTAGGQVSGDSLQPGSYNPAAAEWTKMTYTVVPQSGANTLFYEIRTYSGASMQFDNFYAGVAGGGGGAPSYLAGYSNRTVAGTSQGVTGLVGGATYYFRARAVNGGGASPNSATTNVTTLAALSAPVFGANPGPVATTAGVDTVFAVSASGSPAPSLALAAATAAVDSYDFDAGTGDVLYNPPQGDAGARTFTFTASNSQGTASQTVTVNVAAATAPMFTGGAGPYSTTAGVQVAFTVSASGTPAATLALAGQTASSGYSFTPATGAFSYTPPEADVGTRTFTFTAANAAGTVTQVTSVGVAAVPTAPAAPASVWASATNATDFTAAWSAASGADSYRLDVGTNDTFTGGGGESARFVLASNVASSAGVITGEWSGVVLAGTAYVIMTNSASVITSPAFSTVGFTNLTVDFRARSYGSVSGTSRTNITVSISTNNGTDWTVLGVVAPTNNTLQVQPTVTSTANLGHGQTRIRWQTLSAASGGGVGVSNLVVQGWSGGGGGPAYVAGYSNRTVAGTSESVTGLVESTTYYFRVRAMNAVGTSSDSATASVTTASNAPAGTAPVVDAISAQVTSVGMEFEYTVTATEPDADPVTFACTSAVDEATWDFDANTGDFLFIPTVTQMGTNGFSLTATDKDGTSAPVELSVKVYSAAASNDFTRWVEDREEDPADPDFAEGADIDGDGATTHDEYLADTDPANSNSVLSLSGNYFIASQVGESTGQIRFSFPASTSRFYQLESCSNITNHTTVTTADLGWGVPGMVVTNDSTGTWYGVIRVLLEDPNP